MPQPTEMPSGLGVVISPFPTEKGEVWDLTQSNTRLGRLIEEPSGSIAEIASELGATRVYSTKHGVYFFRVGPHQYFRAVSIGLTMPRHPIIHVFDLEAA